MYAISLISYERNRAQFERMAYFVATVMARAFEARLHWGKHCPLYATELEPLYPCLAAFRQQCRRVDPDGVFRTAYARHVLGL